MQRYYQNKHLFKVGMYRGDKSHIYVMLKNIN